MQPVLILDAITDDDVVVVVTEIDRPWSRVSGLADRILLLYSHHGCMRFSS